MNRFFRRGETEPSERTQKPRRRRAIRAVAIVLGFCSLAAGVSAIALGAYRTTLHSEDAPSHVLVVTSGDEQGGIYDRPVFATSTPPPAPATEVPVAAPAQPPSRDVPYRLVIDKIGVDAPVATYGLDRRQVPEVPSNGSEVAWYNFSAHPGAGGNAVFAGHVTWSGRGVFYHLDELNPGDQLTVLSNGGGTRITYSVSEVFLVDTNDPNAVSVMGPTPGQDVITLITCGGDPFYVGGSAGYDYTHRLIVRAELAAG